MITTSNSLVGHKAMKAGQPAACDIKRKEERDMSAAFKITHDKQQGGKKEKKSETEERSK